MSTLITFGSLGAPAGQPNAIPVQLLVGTADQTGPASNVDPPGVPYADSNGNYCCPTWLRWFASSGDSRNIVLSQRYFPAPVGAGYPRESTNSYQAGACIRVTSAEAYALLCAGCGVA